MNKNPFLMAAFHAFLIACLISWHSQARASLPEDDDSDVSTYLEEADQKASDAILGRTIRQLIAEPNEIPANDRMEELKEIVDTKIPRPISLERWLFDLGFAHFVAAGGVGQLVKVRIHDEWQYEFHEETMYNLNLPTLQITGRPTSAVMIVRPRINHPAELPRIATEVDRKASRNYTVRIYIHFWD